MKIDNTESTLGPNPKDIIERSDWWDLIGGQTLSEDENLMREVEDIYDEFPKPLLG
jgi:hypothetical protein